MVASAISSGKPGPARALLLVDERRIDLGALQLARVIDVDALPLAEEIERRLADLAMPVAGRLDPAEREMRLRADGAVVHVPETRLEVADAAEGEVHVVREQGGREAVLHAVHDAHRLVPVVHRYHRCNGAEDLLLRDPSIRLH